MQARVVLGAIALLALSVVAFAYLSSPGPAAGPAGGPPGAPAGGPGGARPPAVVSTSPVEQGELAIRAEFVGKLQANATADLYAKTSGQLVQVVAETGDFVRAGQVLAVVDDAAAKQGVRQAAAALRMAEATSAQRAAALTIARNDFERVESLFAKKLTSEQDRDAAYAALLSAQAQVELSEASIEQARANLSEAELALQNTRVVAPFNGAIGKRFLDRGAFAAQNRPVFSLVDLTSIKTTISLTEKDAAAVQVGQSATVTTEAYPGLGFEGRVARISPVFDPQTNTTEAEVLVANPKGQLRPGMFATVSVAYRTVPTALLVPKAAVVQNGREASVFVAEEKPDGQGWAARQVSVRLVGTSADGSERVAVDGALETGLPIITLGQETLRDGAPVKLAGKTGPVVSNPKTSGGKPAGG